MRIEPVRLFRPVGTPLPTAALVAAAILAAAGGAAAGWDEVAAFYREARYAEAAAMADSLGAGDESLRALYWRARLGTSPGDVLDALRRAREHPDCGGRLADLFAGETAWIHFARGETDSALVALAAVEPQSRSGDLWLLAGMAEREAGRLQESREAFASVPPEDPEFAWARTFLGRLAQEDGDRALAERYYRAAAEADHPITEPALLAAAWEMDRSADPEAAAAAAERLYRRHPQSLEAARLREILARESEAAGVPSAEPDAGEATVVESAGRARRLALQLAAFSDRGRALAYIDQWRDVLDGLRIVPVRDPHGDVLFKVRQGSFVTRAQAQQAARELEREHGLKVLLVEADESR